jgi:hypothetical protein
MVDSHVGGERRVTMRREWFVIGIALAMSMTVTGWAPMAEGAKHQAAKSEQSVVRTLTGEVTAVDLQATPQTIVVEVPKPGKDALTVGATVDAGTAIKVGGKAAKLGDVKPGDRATIKYEKSDKGLRALAVTVQPKKAAPEKKAKPEKKGK